MTCRLIHKYKPVHVLTTRMDHIRAGLEIKQCSRCGCWHKEEFTRAYYQWLAEEESGAIISFVHKDLIDYTRTPLRN